MITRERTAPARGPTRADDVARRVGDLVGTQDFFAAHMLPLLRAGELRRVTGAVPGLAAAFRTHIQRLQRREAAAAVARCVSRPVSPGKCVACGDRGRAHMVDLVAMRSLPMMPYCGACAGKFMNTTVICMASRILAAPRLRV